MLKSTEKPSSIASAINFKFLHIFFIHFYHSANFKMMYKKTSNLTLAIHTLTVDHSALQSR